MHRKLLVAVLLFLGTLGVQSAANAQPCGQPYGQCPPPAVTPTTKGGGVTPTTRAGEIAAPPTANPGTGELPFTGSDAMTLAGIGLGAVGVGLILHYRSRLSRT
jgi:hypothetical protein